MKRSTTPASEVLSLAMLRLKKYTLSAVIARLICRDLIDPMDPRAYIESTAITEPAHRAENDDNNKGTDEAMNVPRHVRTSADQDEDPNDLLDLSDKDAVDDYLEQHFRFSPDIDAWALFQRGRDQHHERIKLSDKAFCARIRRDYEETHDCNGPPPDALRQIWDDMEDACLKRADESVVFREWEADQRIGARKRKLSGEPRLWEDVVITKARKLNQG